MDSIYHEQSNIQQGPIQIIGAVDLTGKEAHLVELINDGGTAKVQVPSADTDLPFYLLLEGAAAGELSTVVPLADGHCYRARAKGAGNPGDLLCGAAVATAADKGKLRALPGDAGTYRIVAVAEEAFVDGQLVRFRARPTYGNVTV